MEVHPVGERKEPFFEPSFNGSIKVQEGDDRLTSDAGVILLREADQRLGLTESLADQLDDPRQQNLVRYQMSELSRERIYCLAQGYRAQDDVDRLAHDPALRMSTWDRPGEQVVEERSASQPTQSRLVDTVAHVGAQPGSCAWCVGGLAGATSSESERSCGAAWYDRY